MRAASAAAVRRLEIVQKRPINDRAEEQWLLLSHWFGDCVRLLCVCGWVGERGRGGRGGTDICTVCVRECTAPFSIEVLCFSPAFSQCGRRLIVVNVTGMYCMWNRWVTDVGECSAATSTLHILACCLNLMLA